MEKPTERQIKMPHQPFKTTMQLGVVALYALLRYVGEFYFDGNAIVGHFEPASGFALAVLLIGGYRYAWSVFFGALLINAILDNSAWASVIVAFGDTLQALCGAWLLTRKGKFDVRLQSLRDYLRLILLGGGLSVASGSLAVNTALLFAGLLTSENYFHSLAQWWMSDTLGVILIAPLILLWREPGKNRRGAWEMAEAAIALGLTVLVGQIVFLGWWHDAVGQFAKGYWMFLIISWVAIRIGSCGVSAILTVTAVYALQGAARGAGYFADDIAQTHLTNYWLYMVTLSMVGMALATYFTELGQVGRQLRESDKRFRAIIEASPVPFALNDEQQNITYLNSSFTRTFGYTLEDIPTLAEWWRRAYPDPAYRQWVAATWQNHLEKSKHENEPFKQMELDICCKGGGAKTALAGAAPIGASFAGVHLVSFYDITERKRTEEAFRIAAIAFESDDGMMVTDAGRVILRVNHAFSKITGYTAEEVIGQTPSMLKSGQHDTDFYAAMWESICQSGAWKGEILNRRKNGEVYPAQFTITAVKGDAGEVTHYVAMLHDITERKKAEAQINNLAFYDALTQLPNRRMLDDRLGQTMAVSKRSGRYAALMFLDLDNFKPLNDRHGHDMGDLLLIQAAQRITGCVREVDTVARFGGDEFVVILSELDTDKTDSATHAGIVAEKIRATLSEPYLLERKEEDGSKIAVEHRCTSSIGIVLLANHEARPEDILKWADMAMYQAKESGRNSVYFHK